MTPAVRIRPAAVADVPAIDAVIRSNDDHDDGAPLLPGPQHSYLQHLVIHGTTAVAEDGGEIVGFGAAVSNHRATHLADLFVRPTHHGRGIGREIVATVFGESWPRTTFTSHDPAAMPLYIRAGMAPLWPNLYLRGDPRRLRASNEGLAIEPVGFEEVVRLEREWAGVDRTAAVTYWPTLPEVEAFVVADAGRAVAVCIARDRFNRVGRWVDRALVAPGGAPAAPLLAAIRRTARGGELVGACVPGPSPLVPVLIDAGFRIAEWDVFMASDPDLVDPTRQLVDPGLL
jgi:GNAT superfamily N-acetyltransferase